MLKLMLLKNVLSETNYAPLKTDLLLFHSEERPKKKKKKIVGRLVHGMLVFEKPRVNLRETQVSRAAPPEFALCHKLCSGALVVC